MCKTFPARLSHSSRVTRLLLTPLLISLKRKKEEKTMGNTCRKGTARLVSPQAIAAQQTASQQRLFSLLRPTGPDDEAADSFLLRVVQPGRSGLMDDSVSPLAPLGRAGSS
jgi:hypothetical protein